ncbi:hypothetical protein C8R45DRAFT_512586 [Mycena sanguinolenta]|nr:hypothetical protein C8R45DRAFT_512586 [Mycena sanguinolenta]
MRSTLVLVCALGISNFGSGTPLITLGFGSEMNITSRSSHNGHEIQSKTATCPEGPYRALGVEHEAQLAKRAGPCLLRLQLRVRLPSYSALNTRRELSQCRSC